MKNNHAKRVDIVSIKMVKEKSIFYKERNICSPSQAYEILRGFLEDLDREQMIVMCLDAKNQPTNISVASVGTLNSSLVHPREIFKLAILANTSSIILAHNHPSGNPSPSNEDIKVTQRLKEVGTLIGIDVIDHLIIGEDKYVSLKERGIV